MRPSLVILTIAAMGLAGGCGQVEAKDEPTTTRPPAATPTTGPVETPSTTGVAATTTRPATPSTRARALPTTTTTRPATTTTTTTRPLSQAEATSRLCAGVASADTAIQQGSFGVGGLRLASAIGTYGATAEPGVTAGAKAMLRAGRDVDPDGYVAARQATFAACARAGHPQIRRGPIQCIQAPCP